MGVNVVTANRWHKDITELSAWGYALSLGAIPVKYIVTITCGECGLRSTSDCEEDSTWVTCKACGTVNRRPE